MTVLPTYPRRVLNLKEKLKEYNGGEITAAQSRKLILIVAETQLDLWEAFIAHEIRGKELEKLDWFRTVVRWFARYVLPVLVSTGILFALFGNTP